MAGKIIIRRKGSLLPLVCLFLLLILSLSVVWLCTFGLPDFALRHIERVAARQGIYLDIGAVRLVPSLVPTARADRIQLFYDAEKRHRVAFVRSIAAGVRGSALLRGSVEPVSLQLSDADADIPVTSPEGEALNLHVKSIEVVRGTDGVVQITDAQLSVQGISVKIGGDLSSALLRSSDSGKPNLHPENNLLQTLVTPYQDKIDAVYREIRAQHWEKSECPALDVRLHIPNPDVLKKSRISVRATVPRFDYAPHFRFRHAVADLCYNKNVLTINSLHIETVDTETAETPDAAERPNATANLQGGYDLDERRLSVTMKSTAALLRMLRPLCNEKTRDYLSKFRHPDANPPHITLMGDILFGDDFALRDVRVRGSLDQDNLMVGSSRVDRLALSFYYNNGNFNLDKLHLQFQDGFLRAAARAKDRVGQAEISVDLPVQRILALTNELSPVSVALPEGLSLGEQFKMNLRAELDAPLFSPEQSVWQDYVPKVHKLEVSVESQSLSYAESHAVNPSLSITLSGIRQDEKLRPQGMQQVRVSLHATDFLPPSQASLPPAQVSDADVTLSVNDLAFDSHSLPVSAASVSLEAKASKIEQTASVPPETDSPPPESPKALLSVQTPSVALLAQQVGIASYDAPESLRVHRASLRFDSSAASLRDVHVSDMHIHLDDIANIMPLGNVQRLFSAASLSASLNALKLQEEPIGNVELNAELEEYTGGHISLTVNKENDSPSAAFSAHPDWSDPQQIVLSGVDLHLPGEFLRMLLNIGGVASEDVEVPNAVHVSGNLRLLPSMQVKDFALHVDVPELVRTPHRVAVFRGHRIPVGIRAYVDAARSQDSTDLQFNAQLDVTHTTGIFRGLVTGSSAGRIRVEKGFCTIRPDVVDELIDNRRAHSIICDFRFSPSSRSTISDILVDVDFSNGVKVDSFCKAELLNAQYQLNGIEEDDAGHQRVRPGVGGGFPFTHVNRATCGVSSHVVIDCLSEGGFPLADETVVTITDAMLDYDNTPWLRRNKWSTGTKQSVLRGKKIIIDVENSFVELQDVEGKVYPAYSLGMFYANLFDFLEDVVLPRPALVKTQRCLFPIYDDCKLPMSGTISVSSDSGAGFRFIGTTIPLDNFSGFISLSDSFVQLDRMNAKSWDGVLDAVVRIGFAGQHTSLDGYVKADCMDMQKIAASYGSEQSRALCGGEIRFRAPRADVNSLSAYGRADVTGGDIMKLSLFRPVSEMISDLPKHLVNLEKSAKEQQGMPQKPGFFTRTFSWIFKKLGNAVGSTGSTAAHLPGINHLIAYDLKDAHADFRIEHGHLFTTKMKAIGSNLNVRVHADVDLNSLSVRGHLWPKISSLPMLALSPLTILSDFMIDIVLYGSLSDVKWRIALDKRINNSRKPKPQNRPSPSPNP